MAAELDQLHVMVARTGDVDVPAPDAWLDASERTRLEALKAPQRRQQYLAGHWLARDLLAQAYGGGATDWILRECRDRPPAVTSSLVPDPSRSDAIRLGLAHSGDWLVAAVGRQALGIDIEQRGRRLDRAALAPLLLGPDERADDFDDDALLARWVAKEAWIKREQGSALPERLRAIGLHPDPRGELQLFRTPQFHLAVASSAPIRHLGAPQLETAGRWRIGQPRG